ncbi:MAG: hypothetical protein M3Q78_12670 [Acidobacteriota bacterium]|jgi:hypothetical protein|nr:hypothetical protein [Acidobacteriota bacterium]
MSKIKATKNLSKNGNGSKKPKAEILPTNQKESKAYKSAMKAFEMTHKRLYPELYKEKAKRG